MFLATLTPAQTLVADTVVTVTHRDAIAVAADLAVLVAALSVAILAFLAVRVLREWDRGIRRVRGAAESHFGPVADRARTISDNVEFITQALRADVERLNASVKALTERLHQASDHMEERIEEFNALMEMVQGEAEEIFLDTAATVRGVRAGARAMGRKKGEGRTPGSDGDDDDLLIPDEDADAEALLSGEG